MKRNLKHWLPEIGLGLVALFFIYRDLGTFPAPWFDDSFFVIVAKNIAAGRGYTLPVLTYLWPYPPLLAVGPTLLLPVALTIKLFGYSVAIARIPMTLYLLGTTVVMYVWTKRVAGLSAARWSTALLITLSTFVNTGKPVLGEIPGFFFLILGLFVFIRSKQNLGREVLTGILFGLAVVTKLTLGLLFPALALAWLVALATREWKTLRSLSVIGLIAFMVFVAFNPFLRIFTPQYIGELRQYGFAGGGSTFLNVLRNHLGLLTRFQYLYFAAILCAGVIGLWKAKGLLREHRVFIATLIALIILYFLDERGWYRHLLGAHMLLLPFVPTGTRTMLGKQTAAALLTVCIIVQGYWQLTYQGSPLPDEVFSAAHAIEASYAETPIVFLQPEVFVLLPDNPHWLFLSDEISIRDYPLALPDNLPVKPEEHCLPTFRKMTDDQRNALGNRAKQVSGRYYLIAPPKECSGKMPFRTI